jgi:hypothetical protein
MNRGWNFMSRRMIGIIRFDAATFEEFQRVVSSLVKEGLALEIVEDPSEVIPSFSKWQIVITQNKSEGKI